MKYTKEKIHFIMTGGTIDSYYEATKDTAVPSEHSVIPKYIASLNLESADTTFTELCMKDSRQITKEDMENLIKEIENSSADKIIITHGTYTMPDTARYIQVNLKEHSKVVILTGSMIPLIGFSPSDAGFNLGFTIASSFSVEPGVYVSMNGQIFNSDEVSKIISEGRFTSIFNS